MAKRSDVPLAASLQDEAASWVARMDSRTLSKREEAEFETWSNSGPAHQAAFGKYDALWGELGIAAEELAPEQKIGSNNGQVANDRFGPAKWSAIAAAAVLALVVSVNMIDFGPSENQIPTAPVVAESPDSAIAKMVSTDVGEQRVLTMDDGSRITLNTDTMLSTEFVSTKRLVILKHGEAYFEVAHDPNRPFIVQSPNGAVRAVGTKFIVRFDRNRKLSVVVTEGKVLVARKVESLSKSAASVTATPLIAGQELAFSNSDDFAISEIEQDEVGEALAWRQGDIVFNGEPLSVAAAQLQRYSKRKIIVDPKVADYSVGGYFRTNDLDAFAETLESVFPVKVIKTADELRIAPSN